MGIHPEHLMLSILKHKDTLASKILDAMDIDYESYKAELEYVRMEEDGSIEYISDEVNSGDLPLDEENDEGGFSTRQRKKTSKSRTPVLDNFGRDITRLAEENKLDPIIGRETEIERVSQ